MLPEEDDGTESGGPPPDPSLREWRHPSEIAAAKAAAARPATRPSRPMRGPLITFGGTALGVAVLIGLGLYLSDNAVPQQASQRVTIDQPDNLATDPPLATRTSQAAEGETRTEATDDAAADPTEDSADAIDDLDDATADDGVNTTTSSAPPPSAATSISSETVAASSTTTTIDLLAPERRPATEPTNAGVYGLVEGDRLERLGGFLTIDELVYATATAVGDRGEVALGTERGWTTATVVGTDSISGVAVLTVADIAAIELDDDTAESPASSGGERWNRNDEPALGNRVALTPADGPVRGVITAVAQPATVEGGHVVYGALRTSIARQDDAGGSALVDAKRGHLIGLVVDSDDPLVSAIPVATLQEIGASFLAVGAAADEWLGIRGATGLDGGVVIDEIIPDGPADESGLRANEVIVKLDNEPVSSMNHLVYLVRRAGAGNTVRLVLTNGHRQRTVRVTIGTRPPGPSGS